MIENSQVVMRKFESTLNQNMDNGERIEKSISMIQKVSVGPQQLGADSFRRRYGIKYAYLTGGMYKGIASKELVVAVARSGFLAFLGAGGMALNEIESNIQFIQKKLSPGQVYGMNLVCDVNNPKIEMDTVALFIEKGITCIEASAFMLVTPALVYYRLSGLRRNCDGTIDCLHKIIAKVSHPEVARAFLTPPPADIVRKLLDRNQITQEQADMSAHIAMSYDICVEADSGGHTNQGIPTVIFPAIQSLMHQITETYKYDHAIHIGLAGGIGTPQAAVAAFMMGADFVLTGSINQCTIEAGTSDSVKDLLQDINVQDTDYAPAGDMFELGARVQVLKKGVFFPSRANKLFMLYNHYDCLEDIPDRIRIQIEQKYFQKTFSAVWGEVKDYYQKAGRQATLEKAFSNPKHKMALVFKWYFAYSGRLAVTGDEKNRVDFQIHTGPALGAFNQWVKGTELESWRNRHVDLIAEKLMHETAFLLSDQINKLI